MAKNGPNDGDFDPKNAKKWLKIKIFKKGSIGLFKLLQIISLPKIRSFGPFLAIF